MKFFLTYLYGSAEKKDTYLVPLLISSKASLPSLRVLITNQESNMPIKEESKANEIKVLSNLYGSEMIEIKSAKIII